MGERAAKDALFAEFAAVGKVLGHAKRLELLDLLAQGPRSVEELANAAAALGMTTCSAHLQTLREAGLVEAPVARAGASTTRWPVTTSPASGSSCAGWPSGTDPTPSRPAAPTSAPTTWNAVGTDELLRRLEDGDTVVLDVRPGAGVRRRTPARGGAHPARGARASASRELPRDREIVAYCRGQYCVLAHDAVRLLTSRGLSARRAEEGVLEWRVAGLPVQAGPAPGELHAPR